MLRTFIQIMALLLVFVSSFFFVRSFASLSIEDIIKLSQTTYGGTDKHIVGNLTRQKSDTIVGFALLLASLLLSLINLLWPMRASDFEVNRKGLMIAIVVGIVIFISARKISNFLQHRSYEKAIAALEPKETLQEIPR